MCKPSSGGNAINALFNVHCLYRITCFKFTLLKKHSKPLFSYKLTLHVMFNRYTRKHFSVGLESNHDPFHAMKPLKTFPTLTVTHDTELIGTNKAKSELISYHIVQ